MATSITTCTSEQTLEIIHKNFFNAVRAPEKFISTQNKLGASLTKNTKHIFDFVNQQCKDDTFPTCPLDELLTEGFDEEQIWQEIELLNEPTVQHLLQNISNVIARKHKLTFLEEDQKTDQDDKTIGDELMEDGEEDTLENAKDRLEVDRSSDDEEDDSDTNFDIEDVEEKPSKSRRKVTFRPTRTTPSVVDDTFFKLSDMEQFLEMEDAKEERKRRQEEEGKEESDEDESSDEEGDFDYFEELVSTDDDISDDDDDEDDEVILSSKLSPKKMPSTRDMKYTDFFPAPEEAEEEEQDNLKDGERKLDREDEEDVLEEGDEKEADGDDDDDEDDDNLMEDAQLRNYLAMKAAEESESDGEDADDVLGRTKPDEEKSSFEKRQERLRERIQQLEESNISTKPWQMIGEVAGRKRPDNSLLEERLDFEVGSRPAPVITEETTESIETLIMQRIKDQAWDDVERKIKPKEEAFEFKKRVTLDQEKSKMSLGQIYEQEYLKKKEDNPEEEKEDPAHQEIKKMMDSLFLKLDALSNYHFTPKPAVPELKIVTNVPAISMEEVQPISVTDATLLAPEEVKEKSRSEVKGDTEKTQTDRKRERRLKKKGQKVRAQVRERRERETEKNKPETKITGSKDAAMEKLEKASRKSSNKTSIVKDDKNMDKKLLTSSKAFFSKLQEEAVSEVKSLQKRKKLTDVTVSSKKLKL